MKWNSDYLNIIVPVLFIVVGLYAHYRSDKYYQYVKEHGVWTIYEIGPVGYHPRGGKEASIYYVFRGEKFKSGVYLGDRLNVGERGLRFFMALMPKKPTKKINTYDPVPEWFTLDAPDEGWPTKPTEAELREMMAQDSIRRGLKLPR